MSSPLEQTLADTDLDLGHSPDEPLTRGTVVGRYFVLSRLGEGAMGVVYSAYDPELDRKVAIKLLRSSDPDKPIDDERRASLLREAQALAQLSHPNVVAIHDVGTLREQVWLAMEFVEGQTLRQWAEQRPRSWTDVLEVMEQAALGLGAAHEADLLHRDFKPDNVMVSKDGRVRVMDFGLAYKPARDAPSTRSTTQGLDLDIQSELAALAMKTSHSGRVRGSPAYMSPEQMAQAVLDVRSDQFGYCVTLWELLYGSRPFTGETTMAVIGAILRGDVTMPPRRSPVPTWLRRLIVRGLAHQREDRYPSMDALMSAIAQGRVRSRRRWVLVAAGLVAAVAAGTIGIRRHQTVQAERACQAAGAAIDEVWNDQQRAAVRASVLATGVTFAETTADNVMPWIDQQALGWRQAGIDACRHATVDQDWDADRQARAQWCLQGRRYQLDAFIGALLEIDHRTASAAIRAATELEPVDPCVDPAVLDRLPPPPPPEALSAVAQLQHDLAQTNAIVDVTDASIEETQATLGALQVLRQRAQGSGFAPIEAAVLHQESAMLDRMGRYRDAESVGITAFGAAGRSGAWTLAAKIAEDMVFTVGYRQARYPDAVVWVELAEMAAALGGDPLGLREANRLSSHAVARLMGGLESADLLRQARELRVAALGPTHPDVGSIEKRLGNEASRRGAFDEALQHYDQALQIAQKTFGTDHPVIATMYNNICIANRKQGALQDALVHCQRALKIWTDTRRANHPVLAIGSTNLADVHRLLGQLSEAVVLHRKARAIRAEALGTSHPYYAQSTSKVAEVLLRQGAADEARPLLEEAVAIYDASDGLQDNELSARFWLAETLALTGADPAAALSQARRALDGLSEVSGSELATREQIERWIEAREDSPAGDASDPVSLPNSPTPSTPSKSSDPGSSSAPSAPSGSTPQDPPTSPTPPNP